MKISLKWISEFVNVSPYFKNPEKLSQMLTAAGLEVEALEDLAKNFHQVVIGKIIEKKQHPDADKLSICLVNTGGSENHQIVCGAKNHKQGDIVIAALPGAILPGNFSIQKSKLRGVDSGGMLCSFKELGLPQEGDGIAILSETAPIGENYGDWAGHNDLIFELKVTPNRADCLSHWGFAREIAVLTGQKTKIPEPKVKSTPGKAKFQVKVLESEMCPLYSGRVVRGVKVSASPDWMARRLEQVGMKSINNIVDITNYVMMELGQPLHAFDLQQIHGQEIQVGRAAAKEKFVTLNALPEQYLNLVGDELMIRDQDRSLCMAGLIGGQNSGVVDSTTDVFLESAFFEAQFVRKSSRRFGLTTDSGYRFSRGVDPGLTLLALDRATELLLQNCPGATAEEVHVVKGRERKPAEIIISKGLAKERLGYVVAPEDFKKVMISLGCSVTEKGDHFHVGPPGFRFDLELDVDLIEEYARLHGYEHIPECLPAMSLPPTPHDKNYLLESHVVDLMVSLGFSQAVNFAFTSEKKQREMFPDSRALSKTLGLSIPNNSIGLVNPLNETLNAMRISLLPGLLQNLLHNYHYGETLGRLFEVGSIFTKANQKYEETKRISGVSWGKPLSLWGAPSTPLILEVKGVIEALLGQLSIVDFKWQQVTDFGSNQTQTDFFHHGQVATLSVEGKDVGFISSLHPVWLDDNKVRCEAAMFELDLTPLLKDQPRIPRVHHLSKVPSQERDLALVMPESESVGSVQNKILALGGELLKSVTAFDIYRGAPLAPEQKSVAFRLKLQAPMKAVTLKGSESVAEANLTEAQVQETTERILKGLAAQEINVR